VGALDRFYGVHEFLEAVRAVDVGAAVRITASGMPSRSAIRWRLDPAFPLYVAFAAARSPLWPASFPESSDARTSLSHRPL
jgi:hypothetical protein